LGAAVEVKQVCDVDGVTGYDAVVVGSAIQFDTWMSEARQFVTEHADDLAGLPVAYFFTCLTLSDPSDEAVGKADGYARTLTGLTSRVVPVDVGRFGGVLDYHLMDAPTRFASRIVFTVMGVREGDYRDWDAVASWTRAVHGRLFPSG
jgi:menaquinone-dependent protoporphyrinogen oxidase